MSTTAPMTERTVVETLLSLWRRGQSSTMGTLLRDTLAPLPDVQQALEILSRRGCLIDRGPATEAVTLEGTGLAGWRDVLESESRRLHRTLGRRALVYAATTSTSDVAWQHAGDSAAGGTVVLADQQTAGRGRRGNRWEAAAGQSVLMSIVLQGAPRETESLTLLAGLAVAEGLERALGTGVAAEIKWPNDVLINGRKIGGILVETRGSAAVVGVGVNVAQGAADFAADLRDRATSCYLATGRHLDRLRVVEALLAALESRLAPDGGDWLGAWKSRCATLGRRVTLVHAGETLTGEVVDVDPLQGLVLRDLSGALHFLPSRTTTLGS